MAHLGPVNPRWAPYRSHESCYQASHASYYIKFATWYHCLSSEWYVIWQTVGIYYSVAALQNTLSYFQENVMRTDVSQVITRDTSIDLTIPTRTVFLYEIRTQSVLFRRSTGQRWKFLLKREWYGFWLYFCCQSERAVEKTVELPLVRNTMTLIWLISLGLIY